MGGNIDALPNRSPPRNPNQQRGNNDGRDLANQGSNSSNDTRDNRYSDLSQGNNNPMPVLENQNKKGKEPFDQVND